MVNTQLKMVRSEPDVSFSSHAMVDDGWMSAAERKVFESALALVPELQARERQCQEQRNVPAETIRTFHELGLTRILQPKAYGGMQGSTLFLSRVVEELAMGCPSSAWVLSVFGEHAWVLATFPQQAQEDIWRHNPLAVAASSLAPRATAQVVDGGYRLSGTYPFASGCKHADWLIVGAWVESVSGREMRYMLVPMADIVILDDWQTMGLRGTGSNTVALKDAFVPAHRTVLDRSLQTGDTPGSAAHPDYPLLRAPRGAFAIFTQLPVTLALARRVLAHTCLTMRGRVSRGMTTLSDSQIVQCKIGDAAADIDSAIAIANQRHRQVHERMLSGGALTQADAIACRRDSAWASRVARRGIETLVSVSSAEIVHDRNDLQGWYRDSLTTGVHFGANWESAVVPYGRLQLGFAD